MNRLLRAAALGLAAAVLAAVPGRAQEVAAVLSSDSGYYRDTLEGFTRAFEVPVANFTLADKPPQLPASARIVLALGARAALQPYPGRVALVYALAPGVELSRPDGSEPAVQIRMQAPAGVLLAELSRIRPGLKSLAVLWVSASFSSYMKELGTEARKAGVALKVTRIADAAELPAALRALAGKPEALWLPPDPLLLNAQSFAVLKEYCRAARIPFFAPTAGLVEQGAVAAVSVGFPAIGRAAEKAVRSLLAGEAAPSFVYADAVEVTINVRSAGDIGLEIPSETLRRANRVLK